VLRVHRPWRLCHRGVLCVGEVGKRVIILTSSSGWGRWMILLRQRCV
jgi:hypothetical protein